MQTSSSSIMFSRSKLKEVFVVAEAEIHAAESPPPPCDWAHDEL